MHPVIAVAATWIGVSVTAVLGWIGACEIARRTSPRGDHR